MGRILEFTKGRHKGISIERDDVVTVGYLRWLIENEISALMSDGATPACDAAAEELERRGVEL